MTLARFLELAVAVVVLVAMVNCDWWQPSFKRNPKLSLVLSERDSGVSLLSPVVMPGGTELYYLRCPGSYGDIGHAPGGLWRAKIDGSQARLAMDGSFYALALSADGTRLALATDSGYLLLTDADGRVEDTLTDVQTGTLDGVWFSRRDSERLYFRVDYHLHFAINLDGSNIHEVPSDSVDGLPSVQTSGHYSLVTLHPDHNHDDLGIGEAATGDSSPLHAMPYRLCTLNSEWCCWTPDENAVFFSAVEWQIGDPMHPLPAEIWKYEPVFDR